MQQKIFRSLLLFSALIIAAQYTVFAQYQPNIIFWGTPAECGSKRTVSERTVACREFDENGETVRVIENGPVAVSLKIVNDRTRWVGMIHIANGAGETLEVDLTSWRLVHYANEAEFLERSEPLATGNAYIVVERSMPIQADQGPASIGIVDIWRPGEFRNADIVRQSSRTETIPGINPPPKPDPRATSVPQAPGTSRSATVKATTASDGGATVGSSATVSAKTAKVKSIFSSKQLSAKSVSGKKNASGTFFFRSGPESQFRLATINIGDTTYVFEYQDQ